MPPVTLELSEAQVVEMVRQLSAPAKLAVLRALVPELDSLEELVDYGSARVREICTKRGVDWDALSEEERGRWVDTLLHEG